MQLRYFATFLDVRDQPDPLVLRRSRTEPSLLRPVEVSERESNSKRYTVCLPWRAAEMIRKAAAVGTDKGVASPQQAASPSAAGADAAPGAGAEVGRRAASGRAPAGVGDRGVVLGMGCPRARTLFARDAEPAPTAASLAGVVGSEVVERTAAQAWALGGRGPLPAVAPVSSGGGGSARDPLHDQGSSLSPRSGGAVSIETSTDTVTEASQRQSSPDAAVDVGVGLVASGSEAHPLLCAQACAFFAKRGNCREGSDCRFCHYEHAQVHWDKRRRELLRTLEPPRVCALILPVLKEKVMAIDSTWAALLKLEKLARALRRTLGVGDDMFAQLGRKEGSLSRGFRHRNARLLINSLLSLPGARQPDVSIAAEDLVRHLLCVEDFD